MLASFWGQLACCCVALSSYSVLWNIPIVLDMKIPCVFRSTMEKMLFLSWSTWQEHGTYALFSFVAHGLLGWKGIQSPQGGSITLS